MNKNNDMGARRHGQRGQLPPRKIVKCFVHQQLQSKLSRPIIYALFLQLFLGGGALEGSSGSFSSFGLL